MPTARFAVELGDDIWIGEASRSFADAEFRVLSGFPTDRGVEALVEVTGADVDAVAAHARAADAIDAIRVITRTDGGGVFKHESTITPGYETFKRAGVAPSYPVSIRDGEVVVDVTERRERLTRLLDSLREMSADVTVVSVRTGTDSANLLTDRQREVVAVALERGYYDHPRRCTLTSLADDIDVSKSTASDLLQRAESRVMSHVGSTFGDAEAPPER